MQETILAISGKPGLYKLVARGRDNLIVEVIDETHRRVPAGARDRVTSLGDVTMYTETGDIPLMQVFQNISSALNGEGTTFNYKSASAEELEKFMDEVALPAWDRNMVRISDIRKLVQWYNILTKAGYKNFAVSAAVEVVANPAEGEVAAAEESAATSAEKATADAKKSKAVGKKTPKTEKKASTAKKKVSTAEKATPAPAKKSTPKKTTATKTK